MMEKTELKSALESVLFAVGDAVNAAFLADACGVGIATLYRYFPTKLDLVIAISAEQWRKVFDELSKKRIDEKIDDKTAAEQFEFYLDCWIYLYKNHRAMLRFNYDFNYYVANAHVTNDQLSSNSSAVFPFSKSFHSVWEQAQTDGTMRADVTEMDLFSSSMHIMLAVATRYAAGLIYHASSSEDDIKELETLKQMILNEYVIKK